MVEKAASQYVFVTLATTPYEHGWYDGVLDRDKGRDISKMFYRTTNKEYIEGYCQGWLELDELITGEK
jgi:hypothetical protein